MYVGRPRDAFEDYIMIRSEIKPSETERQTIENMTDVERAMLILSLRLELERRHVSYTNLKWPTDELLIFKRIPIRDTLTEHEFVTAIDEMEATVHSVGTVFGMALIKAGVIPTKQLDKEQ